MLSVLSGALLMAASSLIGIAIKRIFRVRYAYFSDAVDFLNLYKREISSLQTPLEDVIKTFVSSSKGAFSDSLQKFADGLPAGYKNVEEVQKTIKNVMIKEKDSLLVAAFCTRSESRILKTKLQIPCAILTFSTKKRANPQSNLIKR